MQQDAISAFRKNLNDLEEIVMQAKRVPLSNMCMVDRERILGLANAITTDLPTVFAECEGVVQNQITIISEANERAEQTKQNATMRANQYVTDAKNQAQQMTAQAQQQAQEIAEVPRHRADVLPAKGHGIDAENCLPHAVYAAKVHALRVPAQRVRAQRRAEIAALLLARRKADGLAVHAQAQKPLVFRHVRSLLQKRGGDKPSRPLSGFYSASSCAGVSTSTRCLQLSFVQTCQEMSFFRSRLSTMGLPQTGQRSSTGMSQEVKSHSGYRSQP